MKIFDVLRAGWTSLGDEGKRRVLEQITPSDIVRDIVLSFDDRFSNHDLEDFDDTVVDPDDEDDDDDIIEAEFEEIKNGFGA